MDIFFLLRLVFWDSPEENLLGCPLFVIRGLETLEYYFLHCHFLTPLWTESHGLRHESSLSARQWGMG